MLFQLKKKDWLPPHFLKSFESNQKKGFHFSTFFSSAFTHLRVFTRKALRFAAPFFLGKKMKKKCSALRLIEKKEAHPSTFFSFEFFFFKCAFFSKGKKTCIKAKRMHFFQRKKKRVNADQCFLDFKKRIDNDDKKILFFLSSF